MNTNRRKNANLLPVAHILTSVAVLVVLFGGGLYYVNAKNEVHRSGKRVNELEKEIQMYTRKDEVVMASIAKLSSYEVLRKRQQQEKDVFAQLVPVSDTVLVRVPEKGPGNGPHSDVRTVSNVQQTK